MLREPLKEFQPKTSPHPRRTTWQRWGERERTNRNKLICAGMSIQLPKLPARACILYRSAYALIRFRFVNCAKSKLAYCPARPLLTRTLTSTRRFSARPDAVSLLAAGSASPIAPGAIMCRTGTLPSWIR